MELCDGEIIVSIQAVDEPDWGSSSAVLEVSYKCNKCGNCCFPELPQTPEEISSFVQTAVLRLSEEDKLVNVCYESEMAHGQMLEAYNPSDKTAWSATISRFMTASSKRTKEKFSELSFDS